MSDWRSFDELIPLRSLAVAIKRAWAAADVLPDARAAFERNPEILSVKTIYVDLAYEEYSRRRDRGEVVDPDEFCDRFPRYRSALLHLIRMYQFVSVNAVMLAECLPGPWP